MNSLEYNGVALKVLKVDNFSSSPVYSEDGADHMYNRHALAVTCAYKPGGPIKSAESFEELKRKLLSPKMPLRFYIGGKPVLDVKGDDLRHGPHPISLDVVQLVGSTVIFHYEIEAWKGCSGKGGIFVSNRWSDTIHVDEFLMATRTITGTAVLRGDAIKGVVSARDVNDIAPPVLESMRRVSTEWHLDSDGLTLHYQVVDEEQWVLLTNEKSNKEGDEKVEAINAGITKVDVNITVWSDATLGAPRGTNIIQVTAYGNRNCSMSNLRGVAVGIVQSHGWTVKEITGVEKGSPLTELVMRCSYNPKIVSVEAKTSTSMVTAVVAMSGLGALIKEKTPFYKLIHLTNNKKETKYSYPVHVLSDVAKLVSSKPKGLCDDIDKYKE